MRARTRVARGGLQGRLSRLQAGVLGANDGIVSVAAVAVGVAGATSEFDAILPATLVALVGGAISIAVSALVSVSSQRDSERALIERERADIRARPDEKVAELSDALRARGLPDAEARRVAADLSLADAVRAHLTLRLNVDPDDIVRPWASAAATAGAFTVGALLPFFSMLLPASVRIPVTFAAVVGALLLTGATGARLGSSPWLPGAVRVAVGGAIALGATYLLGALLNVSGIVA